MDRIAAGGSPGAVGVSDSAASPPAVAGRPLTRRELREAARSGAPLAASDQGVSESDHRMPLGAVSPAADVPAVQCSGFGAAPAAAVSTSRRRRPAAFVAQPAAVDRAATDRAARIAGEAETVEAVPEAGGAASVTVDEFEAAAQLFRFTGATPVQVAAAAADVEPGPDAFGQSPATKRRRGSDILRRFAGASASVGAIGVVGLFVVGMTTPLGATAVNGSASTTSLTVAGTTAVSADEIQAYVSPAEATGTSLDRADYSTASVAQLASAAGITQYSDFFTNNPNSAIQWPFAVGVSISYGFGVRDGTMHEGLDFTPGNGAQIQAVADGTVRIATESGGGYGVMIIIDHVIDGQLVSTRYGHMQYGSLRVSTGDTVKVGQIIGLVGDTGYSFGAHLHFEVLENGTTAIDPLPWLREHAGG